MSDLSAKHCIPCSGGVPALHCEQLTNLLAELGCAWSVLN